MAIKVKYLPTLQNQTFEFTQTSENCHFTHPSVSKLQPVIFHAPKKEKEHKNMQLICPKSYRNVFIYYLKFSF